VTRLDAGALPARRRKQNFLLPEKQLLFLLKFFASSGD